jgi:lactoylglutathione lyase
MYRRIDHVALHVSDLDRSVDFYERNFGFKKYFQHAGGGSGHQIAYLRLGDSVLELTHYPEGSAMAGFHFCLEAEDFNSAVTDLQKRGVEIVRPPHETAAREEREKGWRRVVFGGPDGELIELRGK